jgi:hypothetical protein
MDPSNIVKPLISTECLAAYRADPKVPVIEVDVSPAAYNTGHIPGADPMGRPARRASRDVAMLGELFSLAGRVALVTGGNGGLGRAMALGRAWPRERRDWSGRSR